MLETTKSKVERMFPAETLQKFAHHNLMLVDKSDFELAMRLSNEHANENRTLKIQLKQLQAQLGRK